VFHNNALRTVDLLLHSIVVVRCIQKWQLSFAIEARAEANKTKKRVNPEPESTKQEDQQSVLSSIYSGREAPCGRQGK